MEVKFHVWSITSKKFPMFYACCKPLHTFINKTTTSLTSTISSRKEQTTGPPDSYIYKHLNANLDNEILKEVSLRIENTTENLKYIKVPNIL